MNNTTQPAIQTDKLTKIYKDHDALVDCDLSIPQGSIFGLLGPNGAGKTTLIRTLLGFLHPTRGSAWIQGIDCVRHSIQTRQQVAYLPGEARLYRTMRARDLLQLFSGLHPFGSFERSLRIVERLDLDLSRRVMFMSTGMRQKLALAVVLGSLAPVVILDEPTANLDPTVRSEVVSLILESRTDNRTVLLSSHIFSDIEDTCDQIAVLRTGRLVAQVKRSEIEQIHIVRGRVRTALNVDQEFSFPWLRSVSQSQSGEIELQLAGEPSLWLGWLSGLNLQDTRISDAGIRSFYQRFHSNSSVTIESELAS